MPKRKLISKKTNKKTKRDIKMETLKKKIETIMKNQKTMELKKKQAREALRRLRYS